MVRRLAARDDRRLRIRARHVAMHCSCKCCAHRTVSCDELETEFKFQLGVLRAGYASAAARVCDVAAPSCAVARRRRRTPEASHGCPHPAHRRRAGAGREPHLRHCAESDCTADGAQGAAAQAGWADAGECVLHTVPVRARACAMSSQLLRCVACVCCCRLLSAGDEPGVSGLPGRDSRAAHGAGAAATQPRARCAQEGRVEEVQRQGQEVARLLL